ncbi:MAG: prepilin-type N-terminal cleavage/methylation domain-containing protein [Candidatus Absconditabacterales bacterium]|nr:prepilin-type N-terminal cleavage/methylation domain-containing protein [Candidatus Absconditabacterales bacterium]
MLKRKGFTMVEMLIVIVIIGLLAAALIPRIVGMQARARDTTRASDVRTIKTAFITHASDFGTFPSGPTNNVSDLSGNLAGYLGGNIPLDPQKSRSFNGLATATSNGSYGYQIIRKDGVGSGSFVIMAGMEELGSNSNWVTVTNIDSTWDVRTVFANLCRSIARGASNSTGANQACTAVGDSLRNVTTD